MRRQASALAVRSLGRYRSLGPARPHVPALLGWTPMKLHPLDLAIIAIYLALVVGVGIWVKRRAAKGIESYFLGGRKLPWWMIAMSGSSSYFDITGTMWIVSMFVAYGFAGYWIQWLWGFLIAVFYFAYMGKWIRRSRVVTGAEWMVVRFGSGRGGEAARLAYTLFAILTLTTFLGYTAVGMGKFVTQFLPVKEWLGPQHARHADQVAAVAIMLIAGAYVIVGGFVGLTLVEFVQTIILTSGALMIAYVGWAAFDAGQVDAALRTLAVGEKPLVATDPAWWYSIVPPWRLPAVGNAYAMFGLIVIAYMSKGLLLGVSGPEQLYDFQKFLAARSPREASQIGMLWGVCHTVRFPMAMAITLLGLVAVAGEHTATFDGERVLPRVVADVLPMGLRGIAVAALLSAFMATFGAMVNGAASYLIRDVYQRYLRPEASDRHLVRTSMIASAMMVIVGIAISFTADSIATMIRWILGFLGSAVLVPNVLRWYWWRLNGAGFAAGMFAAMALSLVQAVLQPPWSDYVTIPVLAGSVAIVTIGVTRLTSPTGADVLARFYRTTEPAGAWGPVVAHIRREQPAYRKTQAFAWDALNVVIGLPWLGAIYVGGSYLVAHRYTEAAICAAIAVVGSFVLYRTWYRRLPAPEDTATPRTSVR